MYQYSRITEQEYNVAAAEVDGLFSQTAAPDFLSEIENSGGNVNGTATAPGDPEIPDELKGEEDSFF